MEASSSPKKLEAPLLSGPKRCRMRKSSTPSLSSSILCDMMTLVDLKALVTYWRWAESDGTRPSRSSSCAAAPPPHRVLIIARPRMVFGCMVYGLSFKWLQVGGHSNFYVVRQLVLHYRRNFDVVIGQLDVE